MAQITAAPPDERRRWSALPARSLAVLLVLLGVVLGVGGLRLALLGGSAYYLTAGAGLVATGALLFARRPLALLLFALIVLGTLAWALWEAGFDWWPLAARGDVIFVLGLLLLLPPIWRNLRGDARWAATMLALSLAIAGAVGVAAMLGNVHELHGALPASGRGTTAGAAADDWPAWGGTKYGQRYSTLGQITPRNVGALQVAWTFNTGDVRRPSDPTETTYELTPIKVADSLYLCTPHDEAIALDPATGKVRWRYDPRIVEYAKTLQHLTCRGVAYQAVAAAQCPRRIFLPTADARLIALDADTGRPCAGFGDAGAVSLWQGMPTFQPGFYYSTSPPVTTANLVIVAGEVTDNHSTREPSGVVRAFDAVTGRLVWNWDAGNPDRTAPLGPGERYTANSPNSWSEPSADESLGLIYLPMGNQTPDQFGGYRQPTPERFSSAIVALQIATGRLAWVFQAVHHDLWDMDIGAQPSLVDLRTPAGVTPALVAPTKQGDVYVLDRRTGRPIVPVAERPVPQGAAPGDRTSPTQPFSALTLSPARRLREADMWGATLLDQMLCRIRFRQMRYDGRYTPPSVRGSLVYPGNFGVIDWGGVAVDPVRQIAFANPDYFAFTSRLLPRGPAGGVSGGQSPVSKAGTDGATQEGGANPQLGTPYAVELNPFRSVIGLPCQAPPWGYVAGIDLTSAKVVWRRKNGTVRDVSPVPVPLKMGVPSLGGPIVTGGGVAFMTSTLDYFIRAYDVTTGRELWSARLPAGGQATPMTYRARDGRQYVVAVAGGHGSLGTKAGDAVIAYALPR